MRDNMTAQLEEVARLRHEAPAEVIVEALKIGMSKLYLESVLSLYLKKRLSRSRAIRLVGLEAVELAEKQNKAVAEDIAWGLGRK